MPENFFQDMLLNYVKIKDIKPALSEYIHDSMHLTGPECLPDDKTVHDIRVLMKKSRATIKLARPLLEEETFSREYKTFREVGSILAQWREISVQRKLLKDIRKRYPEIVNQLVNDEKIAVLLRKTGTAAETSPEVMESFPEVYELLKKSYYRIRFLNFDIQDPEKMLKELEKSYDLTKDRYLIARNSPKAANLHEFRKRSKDLLYQLYFFRPLKPSAVKSLEKRLDSMTQALGKYNDIALLKKYIGYNYSPEDKNLSMDELAIILNHEQDRYLSRIWSVAFRIFRPSVKLMDILGFSINAI